MGCGWIFFVNHQKRMTKKKVVNLGLDYIYAFYIMIIEYI